MFLKKIQSNRYLQAFLHILISCLFISLPVIFSPPDTGSRFDSFHNRFVINNLLLVILFYLNTYILYPHIYKKRGSIFYFFILLITVISVYFFSIYLDSQFFPSKHWSPKWFGGFFFSGILSYIFIIGISCSYRIIADNLRQEKIRKEKEHETLKTELSFLRSQVSPHFIFNTLNNLVSLARKKSDMLEPSLIQLSNLIRYMLYESNDSKVSLQREFDYLQNYIDLQRLRFGDDVNVTFKQADTGVYNYTIEPMLLIAFVENAFKHGMGADGPSEITITSYINNGWLNFKVQNFIPAAESAKDKDSGIGLSNVKRRLELLYKNQHDLMITESKETFIIDLKILLHD